MARQTPALLAFNRGEVSTLALARVDVERLRLAAETMENMCPRAIGSMWFRPGTAMISETRSSAKTRQIPFIASTTDTAILELTDLALRVLVNDTPIVRPSVSGSLTALTSFTTSASTGSTVTFPSSKLTFQNVLAKSASTATGTLNVTAGQQNTEHALRIVVERGPVNLRIGTSSGAEDIFSTSALGEGTHSIAFTPGVLTAYVQFESGAYAKRIVSSCALESAGAMVLTTIFPEASLPLIRFAQSADVVFLACKGYQQRKIERRSARSWSFVVYQSDDGPFGAISPDSTVTITPSAAIGEVTLTASQAYFKSTMIGQLIRLFHQGQYTTRSIIKANTFTDLIRVYGVSKVTYASGGSSIPVATNDRTFLVTLSGTWTGNVILYRSTESETSGFTPYQTFTTNQTNYSVADNLDNTICWYKLGVDPTTNLTGICQATLAYGGGGGAGVARIISVASDVSAGVEVLKPFKNVTTALDFRMSQWSDATGWPTATTLHEGRLWFAGATKVWGSVSDNYLSFDLDREGDSGPIQRTIGDGPIANINWLLSLNRLQLGSDGSIPSARSSTFDEPLTPTVFMLKNNITQGTAALQAIKVDARGQFVDSSKMRIYDLKYDVQSNDFGVEDLTRLHPYIAGRPSDGLAGIVAMAAQRQPDTRIHYVRADGQAAILLFDAADNIAAWWRVVMDGLIEDVICLPGQTEDRIYYVVKRTINGVTKRYIERLAMLHECEGGTLSKNIDCHAIYQGSPVATLTGLDYLEGETVCVWADGKDAALVDGVAGYTVAGGSITLAHTVSNAVVGLPYFGKYKSAKLAYAAQQGTAINQMKRLDHIGFLLERTHARGLKYGPSFDRLDDLPMLENGAPVDQHYIWPTYDKIELLFDGESDTDPRFCLQCQSPRPAIIAGVTVNLETHG